MFFYNYNVYIIGYLLIDVLSLGFGKKWIIYIVLFI